MTRLTFVVSIASALASAANAQLANTSFETGQAYPGSGPTTPNINLPGTPTPWMPTSNGYSPDLYDNTGWDGWGLAGIPLYNNGSQNMFQGMLAAHGNRFIGFAASTQFGGINESFQQTTIPLTPGQTYTLSAQMAADDGGKAAAFGGPYWGRGEVRVYLDGNPIGTFTQNTASLTWQLRSFSFVAPASSTAVFTFVAQLDPTPGSGGSSYVALDDLQLVPAPGSLALLGAAGVLGLRRRRT